MNHQAVAHRGDDACTDQAEVDSLSGYLDFATSVCNFSVRQFVGADRAQVASLLHALPLLYPGGAAWLQKRLDDVVDQRAVCTVAAVGPRLVGVVIETPKGLKRRKLSTIFVDPSLRSHGIGSQLLRSCINSWMTLELDQTTVTVRSRNLPAIGPVLLRHGFRVLAIDPNRYGDGEDETVLQWVPSRLSHGVGENFAPG